MAITRDLIIESVWIKRSRTIEVSFAMRVFEDGEELGSKRLSVAITPGDDALALVTQLHPQIGSKFGALIKALATLVHDPASIAAQKAIVAANDRIR